MIEIYCDITQDEYIEAQTLFSREQFRKSRMWRWPLIGCLLIGSLLIFLRSFTSDTYSSIPPTAFGLVVAGLVLLCQPVLLKSNFKSRFKKVQSNLSNMHIIMSAEGYRAEIRERGSGITYWPSIKGWIEGKAVIVLIDGQLMRLVPKRSLTESQIIEVRDLLNEHVGPVGVIRESN